MTNTTQPCTFAHIQEAQKQNVLPPSAIPQDREETELVDTVHQLDILCARLNKLSSSLTQLGTLSSQLAERCKKMDGLQDEDFKV